MGFPGALKTDRLDVEPVKNRLTFLYAERCTVSRSDSAITITDMRGIAYVPVAALSTLLLGPGTKISHRAMELLGDSGTCVIWVGENGVRYYAHGRSLAGSARYAIRQAEIVSNRNSRLKVARAMYQMRFPNEDVSEMTMQQLRGKEGARVRSIYKRCSETYGVPWDKREYVPDDFTNATPINQALSAAHTCLYGVVHSVIVSLGLSPALGIVHTGLEKSFTYDVADLYKADTSIPVAFEVVSEHPDADDVGSLVRRKMRDSLNSFHVIESTVKDMHTLFFGEDELDTPADDRLPDDAISLRLWDDRNETVAAGISYTEGAAQE